MHGWERVAFICMIAIVIVLFVYAGLPNLLTRVFHLFVMQRGPRRPQVALTFDDGPDEDFTPRLLDELQKQQISATFFVLGEKAVQNPSLVQRMVAEGHDVQIHGWEHKPVPLMLPGQALRQITGTQRLLYEKFGVKADFYRPTWGLCNFATLLRPRGKVHLVTWSVMVGDWRVTPSAELYRRIRRKLHPGAIIVLHDSDKTAGAERGAPLTVIEVVSKLAELTRDRGYSFCLLKDWL